MDSASAELGDGVEAVAAQPHQPAPVELAAPHRYLILLGVGLAIVALDQLTKWWAVRELGDGRIVDVAWTLRFNLVRNDGAAFSLGAGITPLIAVAAIGVAVGILVAARSIHRRSLLVVLGLILGGALGNVIDRFAREGDGFLRGRVVDFVDFQWWPVFNVADIGIVVGGALLVLLASGDRAAVAADTGPGGPDPEP